MDSKVIFNYPCLGDNKRCFQEFIDGTISTRVGDTICVMDSEEEDQLDLYKCLVGTVKEIFCDARERGYAVVIWYLRPKQLLPRFSYIKLGSCEVVLDHRNCESVIEISQVLGRCQIIEASVDDDPDDIERREHTTDDVPVYVCRYLFTGASFLPLYPTSRNRKNSENKTQKDFDTKMKDPNWSSNLSIKNKRSRRSSKIDSDSDASTGSNIAASKNKNSSKSELLSGAGKTDKRKNDLCDEDSVDEDIKENSASNRSSRDSKKIEKESASPHKPRKNVNSACRADYNSSDCDTDAIEDNSRTHSENSFKNGNDGRGFRERSSSKGSWVSELVESNDAASDSSRSSCTSFKINLKRVRSNSSILQGITNDLSVDNHSPKAPHSGKKKQTRSVIVRCEEGDSSVASGESLRKLRSYSANKTETSPRANPVRRSRPQYKLEENNTSESDSDSSVFCSSKSKAKKSSNAVKLVEEKPTSVEKGVTVGIPRLEGDDSKGRTPSIVENFPSNTKNSPTEEIVEGLESIKRSGGETCSPLERCVTSSAKRKLYDDTLDDTEIPNHVDLFLPSSGSEEVVSSVTLRKKESKPQRRSDSQTQTLSPREHRTDFELSPLKSPNSPKERTLGLLQSPSGKESSTASASCTSFSPKKKRCEDAETTDHLNLALDTNSSKDVLSSTQGTKILKPQLRSDSETPRSSPLRSNKPQRYLMESSCSESDFESTSSRKSTRKPRLRSTSETKTFSPQKHQANSNNFSPKTPNSVTKEIVGELQSRSSRTTRRGRKSSSALETCATRKSTPSAKKRPCNDASKDNEMVDDADTTEKTPTECSNTPKKLIRTSSRTPSRKMRQSLVPSVPTRSSLAPVPETNLEIARANLHVSKVPAYLPCREAEFQNICCFVEGKIRDLAGGCMYISGMPGTGKTATVHGVVRKLQAKVENKELLNFKFVEVNGLRLTEPRQIYVQILEQINGQKCTAQDAQDMLCKRFTSGAKNKETIVLLVDEVDMLRNRRQDVIYNLLDWPSKPHSRFIVLTIANTMDLPERLLMGRVTSRLGLTRLTFQPYTYRQLQEIVMTRLEGTGLFNPDAVQLVARKVAAVSGDARRALDICRRATEYVEEGSTVTIATIDQTLDQMLNSASVRSIRACSKMEKLFLQAVVSEITRTGVEETTLNDVYKQYKSLCALQGVPVLNQSGTLQLVNRLGSSRLLLTTHSRADFYQSIFLNVSTDDIHYGLSQNLVS